MACLCGEYSTAVSWVCGEPGWRRRHVYIWVWMWIWMWIWVWMVRYRVVTGAGVNKGKKVTAGEAVVGGDSR